MIGHSVDAEKERNGEAKLAPIDAVLPSLLERTEVRNPFVAGGPSPGKLPEEIPYIHSDDLVIPEKTELCSEIVELVLVVL